MTLSPGYPAAVDRFMAWVQSSKPLKGSEFAAAVSVTTSNTLRDAGRCVPDPPVVNEDGSLVIILWNCMSEKGQCGIASLLRVDGDDIRDISLVSAPIGPA